MYGYYQQSKRQRQTAHLAPSVPPQFLERLTTKEVREGESVRFTVRVSGNPPPEITWYREDSQIVSSPDFEIQQDGDLHSLYIPEVFYEDSGKFSVRAVNRAGQCTCTAELIVEAAVSCMEESASPSPPVSPYFTPPHRQSLPPSGSSREPSPPKKRPAIPPKFAKPLRDLSVREGERAVLECWIDPYPQPEGIQWFRNSVEVQVSPDYEIGYENGVCRLVISEVFPEDSGSYTCTVTISGLANSTSMFLRVDAPAAPPAPPLALSPGQRETAPVFEVTLTNHQCLPGKTAYFECRVAANPPPEILWTRRGHPLVDKARYESTYDQYSGVTTLTILNLCDEDEGEYTCTAINSQGETSTSATLLGPDRYQDWLRSQSAGEDRPTDLMSELESKMASPGLPTAMAPPPRHTSPASFYRPMSEKLIDSRMEQEPMHKPLTPEPGFKVSSFEQRLIDEIDFREGRVAPQHHVTDDEAFAEPSDASAAQAPYFEQRLRDYQLMEGSDATFVCKVAGSPLPHVAWYHNGRLIRPSNRYEMKLTRDGYATLRVRLAFPEDAGHYTCCATNLMGRDTSSAELYIEGLGSIDDTSYVSQESLKRLTRSPGSGSRRGSQEPGGVSEKYYRPIFRKVPDDQEVAEGKMCRFDSIVTGRPMPDITWYRDDVQVHDDANHKIVVNEDGFHSLIIYITRKWDSGLYTCIARNRGGEGRFQVSLNVQARKASEPPRFVERLLNQDVRENEPFEFVAEATGYPPPMMSWQKDGRHVDRDPRYRVSTEGGRSSLSCERADARDSAWYQCTAASVAGTASNRARLNVMVDPRKPEPERKLVIPKRSTPTPTQQVEAAPDVRRRPSSEPPKRARADIVLSPSTAPMGADQSRAPLPVQEPACRPVTAPKPAERKPFSPADSDLMAYIQETDKEKPSRDTPDAGLRAREPRMRPSTKQLIKEGVLPEPAEDDMFKKEAPKPPRFVTQIQPLKLKETEPAHFECKLIPIGDPDMKVEWYHNGVPLKYGSRYMPVNDFGYVALDILWTYPEDSGNYICVATNKSGTASTETHIKCYGKKSVIYDSQLPEGDESVQHLHLMEEQIRRDNLRKERIEEGPEPSPPVFDLMPEMQQVDEGDTAKFMCKVSGHPRPRFTWWVNGTIIVNGHRFKLRYDGMINVLEIPKVREYDSGTIRVVAKNPLGEAECSTTLVVLPHEDWRLRLKQAPRSTVGIELEKVGRTELRSIELDTALKRPRTTVTELRAFERSAQERAQAYRDEEVKEAYQAINLQHASMTTTNAYSELRAHEPNLRIQTEAHIERAKHMLGMEGEHKRETEVPRLARTGKTEEAPSFGKPLMNMKAKEGKTVKLEVTFSGFPYPDVQWFREGLEIQHSPAFKITTLNNKSFLLITEVFPEDAGVFSVRATNRFGMVECKAVLEVTPDPTKGRDTSPEFKVQMRDVTVRLGEPATFDVSITGSPKPDVYWAKDGKRLYESKRWKFITEQDHFTLLIYEVTEHDRGVYECIVVNKLGKATCSARLQTEGTRPSPAHPGKGGLGYLQAPQLVTPLKDAQVNEGDSVTIQCKIIAVPDPVVQWYHDNELIKPSKYFQMYSERGIHSLHIAGAFPEDGGVYKCTARNQAGEVTCIAHLKVIATVSEPDTDAIKSMEAPRFSRSINSVEVQPGAPAHFIVEVGGSPLPEITWFREGHQILHSDDFQIIMEENKCILYIKEVFPEDSGIFTCRCTNPAGVAECSAELAVEDPTQVSKAQMQMAGPPRTAPTVLKAPSPVREVLPGATTKLLVQLAAYPPPRFTWFVNGIALRPDQRHKVNYDNGLVTLIIFNATAEDAGEYVLKARNELGETTCTTILIIQPTQRVVELPVGTQEVTISSSRREALKTEVMPTFTKPMPPEIRVRERAIAKLEAYVEAYPPPLITWHVNGSTIKPSPKYTVKHEGNKAILLVKDVTVQDAGTYSCRAVSDLGEAVCSTTLFVTGAAPKPAAPRFTIKLQQTQAVDGQEVTVTCQVSGNPMPDIHWFHNDKNIDKCEDFVINYDRRTGNIELVIVDVLMEDSGVFKCVARNHAGQDVTSCKVTVSPAPEETTRPERAQPVKTVPAKQQKVVVQQGDREVMHTAMESEIERKMHQKEVKVVKRIVKRQSGQPPKFSKPIQPQVVKEGEDAPFTACVSGAPQPEIVWLKDKVPLPPSNKHVMNFDPDSGTCTLRIIRAEPSDIGVYSCRAENPAGKATCTANVVVVHTDKDIALGQSKHMKPPVFVEPFKALRVPLGEDAIFKCRLTGKPMPSVVWYHNDKKIQMNGRVFMKFGRESGEWELHVLKVIPEDTGAFRCTATNPVGEATAEATLTVEGTLRFAVVPESRIQYVVEDPNVQPWRAMPILQEGVEIKYHVTSSSKELTEEPKDEAAVESSQRKHAAQFEVEEDTKTETVMKSEHEYAIKAGEMSSYDKNVTEHTSTMDETVRPIEGAEPALEVAAIQDHESFPETPEHSEHREKALKASNEDDVAHMQVQKKNVTRDIKSDPSKTNITTTTKKAAVGNITVVETETVSVKTSASVGVVKESYTDTQVISSEKSYVSEKDDLKSLQAKGVEKVKALGWGKHMVEVLAVEHSQSVPKPEEGSVSNESVSDTKEKEVVSTEAKTEDTSAVITLSTEPIQSEIKLSGVESSDATSESTVTLSTEPVQVEMQLETISETEESSVAAAARSSEMQSEASFSFSIGKGSTDVVNEVSTDATESSFTLSTVAGIEPTVESSETSSVATVVHTEKQEQSIASMSSTSSGTMGTVTTVTEQTEGEPSEEIVEREEVGPDGSIVKVVTRKVTGPVVKKTTTVFTTSETEVSGESTAESVTIVSDGGMTEQGASEEVSFTMTVAGIEPPK